MSQSYDDLESQIGDLGVNLHQPENLSKVVNLHTKQPTELVRIFPMTSKILWITF